MDKSDSYYAGLTPGNEGRSGENNFDSERALLNDGEKTKIIKGLIELKSKMANLNLQISDLENSIYTGILSLSGLISMYRLASKESPKDEVISQFDTLFDKYIKPRKIK